MFGAGGMLYVFKVTLISLCFRFRRAPRPVVDPCGGRRDTTRDMYKSVKRETNSIGMRW